MKQPIHVPRELLVMLVRSLPAPVYRHFADAIVTRDMPKGSLRDFDRIAASIPGARRWGSHWTIPIDTWTDLRGADDPPAQCVCCRELVVSRPPRAGDVIATCRGKLVAHRPRAERMHPEATRMLVHVGEPPPPPKPRQRRRRR
ncbi:MAG: hypothetical protein KF850_24310 [Labilithrix sp.]|nr:hypothetical protein [Labilithrix sp.]